MSLDGSQRIEAKPRITRNLRQNGGRPDSTQTFRSLRMAGDRYREMYGEN